jgi:hypothetical protein
VSASPTAAIAQLEQDRSGLAAKQAQGPGGPTEESILTQKAADLAPTQDKLTAANADIANVKPPGPASMPATPSGPLVDPKEYQKLSWGLLAMAMIGGSVSRGNWMGVSASLNGALKGYLEGNKERAKTEWDRYNADFEKAVNKHKEQQEDYLDTLNNKKLSINGILSELQTKAAKWDDQALLARARAKSFDEVTKQVYAMDKSIAELSMRKEEVDKKANAAMGATGSDLTPEAQKLQDDLRRLDPSFMSRLSAKGMQSVNKTIGDWAEQGYSAEDVIAGRIGTKVKGTEGTVLGRREAAILPVEKSITRPGGFLEQAEKAVDAVDFPRLKKAGEFDKWTKEQNSDPKLSAYKAAVAELRAEYSIVLSKGGQVTDAARSEAKEVVPDLITKDQFQSIKKTIKQGIEASKSGVEESISDISGKQSGPKVVHWDDLK